MNFLRKMVNRDYDIKLNMPYEEFGKRLVYMNNGVRKNPKDVFVIKFNDCTKVYAVSDKCIVCSECPMRIKGRDNITLGCCLKRKVEYDIDVCVCSYVGKTRSMRNIGFIDMDTILEDL